MLIRKARIILTVVLNGLLPVMFSLTCPPAARCGSSKDALDAKYRRKLAEVLQEGLVIGNCNGITFAGGDLGAHGVYVGVGIDEHGVERVANMFQCAIQPIHKGEILSIEKVRTADHGRAILLQTSPLSPHSWTRGIGAFEHESHEIGVTILVFKSSSDPAGLIPKWLRIPPSVDAKLGNTASMVQVKQVKLGMSFAEVEEALGLPTTRVDLGPKVLYKYKDMAIEFHDGKVTDVR